MDAVKCRPILVVDDDLDACEALSVLLKLGLLEIVWMNFQLLAVESPLEQGLAEFSEVRRLGMNWRWEERGGWWMCTASPHFVCGRQYEGCSGIPRSASYDLSGGEKNSVWG